MLIGAFMLFCGFYNWSAEPGALALVAFFMVCGGVPLWMAWSLLQSARRDAAERQQQQEQDRERAVLAVAAKHGGRITPGLLVASTGRWTIVQAKETLSQMAANGFCALESDDHGTLYYQFDLGLPAPPEAPQRQQRLTGEAGETLLDADK